MSDHPVLSIEGRGLRKRYKTSLALDGVDLRVEPGEFVSLLGPSGSGKTTLLMMLAGFVLPDEGTLFFGGESVSARPPHKRNVGMVFQSHALFPHMNVFENVAFPLRLRRTPKADIEARVGEALALVRLKGFEARNITQLSGGQSQRVALARAIVFRPGILLMDEPLSALDRQLRDEMQMEILNLHEKLGHTTVYVTHDQREALTMSDRVAVLNQGRILQMDAPERLYDRPSDRFVASFIGESNLIPLAARDGALWFGDRPVPMAPIGPGGHVLVVRAEQLRIAAGESVAADELVFEGDLIRSVFQGDCRLSHIRLADGVDIRVRHGQGDREAVAGARIRCVVRRQDAVLLQEREA